MMISYLWKIISSLLVVTAKATEVSTLHDWHQIQPDTASVVLPSSLSTNLRRRCKYAKCDSMIAGNPSSQRLSIGNLGDTNMQHRRIERRRKLSWAGSLYNMLRIPGLKHSHPNGNSAGGSSGNSADRSGGDDNLSDSSSHKGLSRDKSMAGSGGGRSSGEGSPGNGESESGSNSNSSSSGGTSSSSSGGGFSGGAGGGSQVGGTSNGGSSGGTSSSSGSSSGSSSSSSGGSSSGSSGGTGGGNGDNNGSGDSSGRILILTSAALSLSIGAMYIGGRRARRTETATLHPLHGAVKKRAAVFSLIAKRSNLSRPEAPTLSIDKTDIAANTNYVLA